MSEWKPTIAAMREWLKTCPLIAEEQSETGAAFRISGLSPEPVVEFSIEDSPTDPVLVHYFSGRQMAHSYLFLSRRVYSEAQSIAIANSGFFEQLTDWVLAQPPPRPLGLRQRKAAAQRLGHVQRLHRHQRGRSLQDAAPTPAGLLSTQTLKGASP